MNKKQFIQVVDSELAAAIAAAGAAGAVAEIRRRGIIPTAWETLKKRTRRAVVRYMVCTAHRGKMKGLFSLSTACTLNPECLRRHGGNCGICGKCYSFEINKNMPALRHKLERNTAILCSCVITADDIPDGLEPPSRQFRFESFGDLLPGAAGRLQWDNYRRIATGLYPLHCAVWTKHPNITNTRRPDNLSLVWSVTAINPTEKAVYAVVAAAESLRKYGGRPDAVFVTYDENYPAVITCGRAKCDHTNGGCGRCYFRNWGSVAIIRERVKFITA